MVLIFGGAYAGKLDYAKKNYGGKIFRCTEDIPDADLSADIIDSLHKLILAQVKNGTETRNYLQKNMPLLKGKVVICDDISCGIVPVSAELRKWREETGRALALLSAEADEVYRVFFGIASKLK
ncbi:MAG: bifunctional adenosylcobinamide kinase/adenosylcobinamide-phosphate guanylyltransferase [Defluviitaleaceae bacterium]|nr:bifunctional adenosylcobinamide kinase/adenosylcobinamide-phosphate guanylyltransferase [Defluviitaleaceae bacterium]